MEENLPHLPDGNCDLAFHGETLSIRSATRGHYVRTAGRLSGTVRGASPYWCASRVIYFLATSRIPRIGLSVSTAESRAHRNHCGATLPAGGTGFDGTSAATVGSRERVGPSCNMMPCAPRCVDASRGPENAARYCWAPSGWDCRVDGSRFPPPTVTQSSRARGRLTFRCQCADRAGLVITFTMRPRPMVHAVLSRRNGWATATHPGRGMSISSRGSTAGDQLAA